MEALCPLPAAEETECIRAAVTSEEFSRVRDRVPAEYLPLDCVGAYAQRTEGLSRRCVVFGGGGQSAVEASVIIYLRGPVVTHTVCNIEGADISVRDMSEKEPPTIGG